MLIILKFIQEMICSQAVILMSIRIRERKGKNVLTAIICWTLISLSICLMAIFHADVWQGVDMRRPLQLLGFSLMFFWGGPAVYGGAVRWMLAMLIGDAFIGSTTYLSMIITAVLTGNTLQFVMNHIELSYHPGTIFLNYLLCAVVLYLLKPLIMRLRNSSVEQSKVVRTGAVLMFLIMLSPLIFKQNTYFAHEQQVLQPFTATAIMGVSAAFLGLYYYYEMIRKENQNLQLEIQSISEQMEGLKEHVLWTRRLRHDIRRHMNVLRWTDGGQLSQIQMERRKEYRNQLEELYKQLSFGDYCNDPGVNSVIRQLEQNCRRYGIPLDIRLKNADLSSLSHVYEMMLYSVMWAGMQISFFKEETESVECTASENSGKNQLQICVHVRAEKPLKIKDDSLKEILRRMRQSMKEAETVEIQEEADRKTLILCWNTGGKM